MVLRFPTGSVLLRWCLLAVVVLLQACATVAYPDRRDPLESMNRSIYSFNDRLDTALVNQKHGL